MAGGEGKGGRFFQGNIFFAPLQVTKYEGQKSHLMGEITASHSKLEEAKMLVNDLEEENVSWVGNFEQLISSLNLNSELLR